jgi:hypothetical protein
MGIDVRLIAAARQEPRLDRSPAANALDPTAALGKPHVAQASAEQTALPLVLRNDAERTEALIDEVGMTPSPSSAQTSSCCQLRSAGRWRPRTAALQARRNSGGACGSSFNGAASGQGGGAGSSFVSRLPTVRIGNTIRRCDCSPGRR